MPLVRLNLTAIWCHNLSRTAEEGVGEVLGGRGGYGRGFC